MAGARDRTLPSLGFRVGFLFGANGALISGNKKLKVNFESLLSNFQKSEAKLDAKATFKVRTNFEKLTFKSRSLLWKPTLEIKS